MKSKLLLIVMGISSISYLLADTMRDIANLDAKNFATKDMQKVNKLKARVLTETAITYGAQIALHEKSQQIKADLAKYSAELDSIFTFNPFLLKGNVLSPVIVTSDHNIKLESDAKTIKLLDKNYIIYKNAKFVTNPPNWRDYLVKNYTKPAIPPKSLLPNNKAEKAIWKAAVKKGYKLGIQQAIDIFNSNLSRLKRDIKGMLLYKKLLIQGMITMPFVANSQKNIISDSDSLHINNTIVKLTVSPTMVQDTNAWKPVFVTKK